MVLWSIFLCIAHTTTAGHVFSDGSKMSAVKSWNVSQPRRRRQLNLTQLAEAQHRLLTLTTTPTAWAQQCQRSSLEWCCDNPTQASKSRKGPEQRPHVNSIASAVLLRRGETTLAKLSFAGGQCLQRTGDPDHGPWDSVMFLAAFWSWQLNPSRTVTVVVWRFHSLFPLPRCRRL